MVEIDERSGQHGGVDRLLSLEATDGYLKGARLEFLPGLNCIIGDRGSGKTTVVEFIRFALDAPVPPGEERQTESLVKANLRDGRGRAAVTVATAHGGRYDVSRAPGEQPRVKGASGEWVDVKPSGDLFRADIYAQNQILAIANSTGAQLALLDGFAEDELRPLVRALAETESSLVRNAELLVRLADQADADESLVSELAAVREQLRVLAASGTEASRDIDEAQEAKASRERERRTLEAGAKRLAELDADVTASVARWRAACGVFLPAEPQRGENAAPFASIRGPVEAVDTALLHLGDGVRGAVASAVAEVASVAAEVRQVHLSKDEAFDLAMAQHALHRERLVERERLARRELELSDLDERVRLRTLQEQEAVRARKAQLAELSRLRAERFAIRTRVAAEMTAALGGEIRVTVTSGGAFESYALLLEELLRGANVRPASLVRSVAESVRPADLEDAIETMNPDVIVAADDSKTGRTERALRLLGALRAHPRRFEIAAAPLEDVPLIELRAGQAYKPSSRVSIGQRCTCILPLLLLQPRGPLIIDQPEDHIDNAFIYNVLVKSIEKVKTTRQLIFVTHNPNIPVLGDADRVFYLESDGERATLAGAGTVDELREPLERLLEGGREAFLRRGERYGAGGPRGGTQIPPLVEDDPSSNPPPL